MTTRQALVDRRLSIAARCLLAYLIDGAAPATRAASDLGISERQVWRLRREIRELYPDAHVTASTVTLTPASGSLYKERAPAPVSHQNEKTKNLSDDEKNSGTQPKPTPETPEAQFRSRIARRHPGTDVEHCLRSVKRYLGSIELSEFLAYDEQRTMSPHLLRNPTGHYVELSKSLAKGARDRLLLLGLETVIRKPMEVARCICAGGRTAAGYCGCSMGRDLARVEGRRGATAAR
jgi:hypothetical protein